MAERNRDVIEKLPGPRGHDCEDVRRACNDGGHCDRLRETRRHLSTPGRPRVAALGRVDRVSADDPREVAFFTARLWGVAQPIMTRADPDRMTDLRRNEPELVKSANEQTATLNGVRSLASYELRAHRFARIADSRPDPDAGMLPGPRCGDPRGMSARQPPAQLRSSSGDARARVVKSFWSAFFFLGGFFRGRRRDVRNRLRPPGQCARG